jgi:hypothetical protein
MSKKLLRLNPGDLPESAQLVAVTKEVLTVQEMASRETAGAISPSRQLLTLRRVLAKHEVAIEAVRSAARECHGNVISPRNGFELAIAMNVYVVTAHLWLTRSRDMDELADREPPHRAMSSRRSLDERAGVLSKVDDYVESGKAAIRDLGEFRVPKTGKSLEQLNLELYLRRVGVALTAADISPKFAPPPVSEVLRELSAIRAGATFARQPQHLQAKYWQITAALEQGAGDEARMRDAVREWRRLTPRDVDAQLRLHLELVQLATSDAERLEHMHTLRKLAERPGLGPLFSRERLGRLSVLRDVFWAIPARVDASSPYANAIIEEAFAAYGLWLYGRPIAVDSRSICFLAAWKGRGHLSWSDDGTRRVEATAIPDDLLPDFLADIESLKPLGDAMREMSAFLDAHVAPPLSDGDEITGETRLVVGGGASLLPVLATNVNGQSLGARGAAYCHPNPTVAGAPATTLPFDLLVVDRTFGSPSRDVVEAWELVASPSAGMKKLEFDSSAAAGRLSVDSLQDALLGCRRALVFSHVNNPTFHGGQGGIFLGGGQHLSPEAIAPMALGGLEELVIVGCGSGRDNLFVGGVSVAHAAAVAGAREVLYTRWTITSEVGANFAVALMDARRNGMALEAFLASTYADDSALASVYGMIRP